MEFETWKIIVGSTGVIGIIGGIFWCIMHFSYRTGKIINILENHIKNTDLHFSEMKAEFENIHMRLDRMDGRLNQIENRLSHIEGFLLGTGQKTGTAR
jgi:hypothetical protein